MSLVNRLSTLVSSMNSSIKKSPFKLIFVLFLVAFTIFFIGNNARVGRLWTTPRFAVDSLSYLFGKFNAFHKFTDQARQWKSLSTKNGQLIEENNNLIAGLAKLDILEEENDFLKKALDIKQEIGENIIYAHVFNLNLGSDGYNVLLNKGTDDGVAKDDVVITEGKALVGVVSEVSANSSRILFVSDPKFKVTAKVMGGTTAGIAKGALGEGMSLDLVTKEDEIAEGDILISMGNDMFPAALVVGKVSYIKVDESRIFKTVRIDPAPALKYLGRVIIIKKN